MEEIKNAILNHMKFLGPNRIEEILEKGYFYLGADTKVQIHTQPFIPKGQIYLMDLKAGAFSYGIDLGYDYSVVLGTGPKSEEDMIEKSLLIDYEARTNG